MRRIDAAQRRARLALRHHLASPADAVEDAARSLIGLHSTDPITPMLAARARVAGFRPEDLESALYEQRRLARVLCMRRTIFVVPADAVAMIHAACTRALDVGERARTARMIEEAGIAEDGQTFLKRVSDDTYAALAARGEATAAELSVDVPELTGKIPVGQGKRWEGTIGVSTRVLFLLATEGRILRGRPRGSWLSTQYRWAPLRDWLGADVDALDTETARTELGRAWLRAFGPGLRDDLKWWAGWTVAQTKAALSALDVVEVDLDGAVGVVLADDLDPVEPPEPWAALLPPLDPTVMGWKHRDWYLGEHGPVLFDRNGNPGPTVWWEGRMVGGWAQRRDGEIAVRLLSDVGADAAAAIDAEAAAVAEWLGEVRFSSRFPGPLERELLA